MNDIDNKIEKLKELYLTPNSSIFLSKNAQDIYKNVKEDVLFHSTTYPDILRLKNTVESDFRQREHRILRGKTRYLSRRKFQAFSPCTILLGEFF